MGTARPYTCEKRRRTNGNVKERPSIFLQSYRFASCSFPTLPPCRRCSCCRCASNRSCTQCRGCSVGGDVAAGRVQACPGRRSGYGECCETKPNAALQNSVLSTSIPVLVVQQQCYATLSVCPCYFSFYLFVPQSLLLAKAI
jgi:hypothetical protein